MKTPTRQAPHICDQVVFQIWASCEPLTRSSSATTIHDARIAEPPTNGLKSNAAVIVAPGAIEDAAATARCSQLIPGSIDHGPVQATTMSDQHDDRQPALEHFAGREPVTLGLRFLRRRHRHAAIAERLRRLPEFEQQRAGRRSRRWRR